MPKVYLTICLALAFTTLLSQSTTNTDTLRNLPEQEQISIGYEGISLNQRTGSYVHLSSENFNRGNVFDPALSWQGKIAGLSIYNRGGNPNSSTLMRIRGISSFDTQGMPLIVIDEVPMASLDNLDPHDIESISVLKDAASSTIYGIRGSNGIILIKTKSGANQKGLTITYQSDFAASHIIKKQPVLSARDHILLGANDLGSSTDWQDEITRTSLSNSHHIAVMADNGASSIRISTNIRNVNGILLHSGFNQINTRVGLSHNALNKRLRLNFNLALTNRKIDYSFPEAFRYANIFLPSAPITLANGNYYQAILFDNYNPVAILEQNLNRGRRRNTNFNSKLDFDIFKNLTATVNVAHQSQNNFNGTYYSRNSFYVGLGRKGLAQRYTNDQVFTFTEGYFTYFKRKNKLSFTALTGFSYQQDQYEDFQVQLGNFPSDELGYNAIEYSADILTGQSNLIGISSTTSPINKFNSFFFRARISIDHLIAVQTTLSYSNSTKLGNNYQGAIFPSLGINYNLLSLFKNLNLSFFNGRMSYGLTGTTPTQWGLSQDRYEYSFNNGGSVYKVWDGNQNLKWEQGKEINIGFDLGSKKFNATIDVYQRRNTNLIQLLTVDPEKYPSGFRHENSSELKTVGLEILLDYTTQLPGRVNWNTSLVISSNKTTLERYPVSKEMRGFPDGPGCGCSTQLIRVAVGDRLGTIWGPVFEGVNSNGGSIFKDVNGDGQLLVEPGFALEPLTDFTKLGNAFPSWEFGWNNQFVFKKWDLNAFFRGALGHSLVNLLRLANEPVDLGAINSYNRVKTEKAVSGLASSQFSSLYVENASFLKLDNITLGYSVDVRKSLWLKTLRFYATIQNVFVLTNYSGIDPEPILIDQVTFTPNFTISSDVLVSGIDRNRNYAPARTFLMGFRIGL